MKISLDNSIATNLFAGFGNNNVATPTPITYASQFIGTGTYSQFSIRVPLPSHNPIVQIQIMYGGLESFWRLLPGVSIVDFPDAGAAQYQIETYSFFDDTSLYINGYVINQTGGTITFPGMTLAAKFFVYNAPF